MTHLALLVCAACAVVSPAGPPPASDTVRVARIDLSFYAVTGALVGRVLERLGHTVRYRSGPHEAMFPLVAGGEVDLLVAAWLPTGHAEYWRRHGGTVREVGTLYEGARFFWGVPDYVPATSVRSLADLARPEVAARMRREVRSVGAGAGITRLSGDVVRGYRLDAAGYSVVPGTAAQWVRTWEEAVARREWVVIPLWEPHWLVLAHRIRPLRDPRGALGATDRAVLVAGPGTRLPDRTLRVLRAIRVTVAEVSEMDHRVNVRGMTADQAADSWMRENPERVRGWLESR